MTALAAEDLARAFDADFARPAAPRTAAGGVTISQDEAGCVVCGTPREAEALGASMRVLPLAEIGPAIAAFDSPPGPPRGRP